MSESRKTLIYAGVALVLALIAFAMAPSRITPDAFLDQGEQFFPEFTDPNEATTLEVIDYDEETGAANPFKVTFKNGRWTIPSHHDYPADAKDRLARTAAGIIDIKKDDFRTDNVADHEGCGVVDPLDEGAAGLSGRGKHVTVKGIGGQVLADFIIGREVLARQGFRFVRVPGQNRVYASRVDVDISTRFEDWIERDLLQVETNKIDRVELKDYSINERTYSVEQRDNLALTLRDGTWKASRMSKMQQVDSANMKQLLSALDDLAIIGVRPKPQGLSANLKSGNDDASVSTSDQVSLQRKGFYLSRDGQLLSNEGELQVHTTDGVSYTIRFGEVLYGSGLEVTAGTADDESKEGSSQENRYLFITASFDEGIFGPEPPEPGNRDFLAKPDSILTEEDIENRQLHEVHSAWARKYNNGRDKAQALNDRFADWYYVISASSFDRLDLDRDDLIVNKT